MPHTLNHIWYLKASGIMPAKLADNCNIAENLHHACHKKDRYTLIEQSLYEIL